MEIFCMRFFQYFRMETMIESSSCHVSFNRNTKFCSCSCESTSFFAFCFDDWRSNGQLMNGNRWSSNYCVISAWTEFLFFLSSATCELIKMAANQQNYLVFGEDTLKKLKRYRYSAVGSSVWLEPPYVFLTLTGVIYHHYNSFGKSWLFDWFNLLHKCFNCIEKIINYNYVISIYQFQSQELCCAHTSTYIWQRQ